MRTLTIAYSNGQLSRLVIDEVRILLDCTQTNVDVLLGALHFCEFYFRIP